MAGLLAANMLRRHKPVVHEKSGNLPNNHSALLRFRNLSVSDATGIPFEKILVSKSVWDGDCHQNYCTISQANSYSQKVTGEVHRRSILNLEDETRYLAPSDFVLQMANSVSTHYNSDVHPMEMDKDEPIISTIPMPTLMRMLGWPKERTPKFQGQKKVHTIRAKIYGFPISVHQTVYFPDYKSELFRATLQGNQLIIELTKVDDSEVWIDSVLDFVLSEVFGIVDCETSVPQLSTIPLGKIAPIPESTRKEFIVWASEEHNIYSLGRFATWRPGLLLDSLPNDIKTIEGLILSGNSKYEQKLKQTKR